MSPDNTVDMRSCRESTNGRASLARRISYGPLSVAIGEQHYQKDQQQENRGTQFLGLKLSALQIRSSAAITVQSMWRGKLARIRLRRKKDTLHIRHRIQRSSFCSTPTKDHTPSSFSSPFPAVRDHNARNTGCSAGTRAPPSPASNDAAGGNAVGSVLPAAYAPRAFPSAPSHPVDAAWPLAASADLIRPPSTDGSSTHSADAPCIPDTGSSTQRVVKKPVAVVGRNAQYPNMPEEPHDVQHARSKGTRKSRGEIGIPIGEWHCRASIPTGESPLRVKNGRVKKRRVMSTELLPTPLTAAVGDPATMKTTSSLSRRVAVSMEKLHDRPPSPIKSRFNAVRTVADDALVKMPVWWSLDLSESHASSAEPSTMHESKSISRPATAYASSCEPLEAHASNCAPSATQKLALACSSEPLNARIDASVLCDELPPTLRKPPLGAIALNDNGFSKQQKIGLGIATDKKWSRALQKTTADENSSPLTLLRAHLSATDSSNAVRTSIPPRQRQWRNMLLTADKEWRETLAQRLNDGAVTSWTNPPPSRLRLPVYGRAQTRGSTSKQQQHPLPAFLQAGGTKSLHLAAPKIDGGTFSTAGTTATPDDSVITEKSTRLAYSELSHSGSSSPLELTLESRCSSVLSLTLGSSDEDGEVYSGSSRSAEVYSNNTSSLSPCRSRTTSCGASALKTMNNTSPSATGEQRRRVQHQAQQQNHQLWHQEYQRQQHPQYKQHQLYQQHQQLLRQQPWQVQVQLQQRLQHQQQQHQLLEQQQPQQRQPQQHQHQQQQQKYIRPREQQQPPQQRVKCARLLKRKKRDPLASFDVYVPNGRGGARFHFENDGPPRHSNDTARVHTRHQHVASASGRDLLPDVANDSAAHHYAHKSHGAAPTANDANEEPVIQPPDVLRHASGLGELSGPDEVYPQSSQLATESCPTHDSQTSVRRHMCHHEPSPRATLQHVSPPATDPAQPHAYKHECAQATHSTACNVRNDGQPPASAVCSAQYPANTQPHPYAYPGNIMPVPACTPPPTPPPYSYTAREPPPANNCHSHQPPPTPPHAYGAASQHLSHPSAASRSSFPRYATYPAQTNTPTAPYPYSGPAAHPVQANAPTAPYPYPSYAAYPVQTNTPTAPYPYSGPAAYPVQANAPTAPYPFPCYAAYPVQTNAPTAPYPYPGSAAYPVQANTPTAPYPFPCYAAYPVQANPSATPYPY